MRPLMGRDPTPTRAEYDALVDALWDGDPLMDAALERFASGGRGRRAFELALERGVAAVPDAPTELRALFEVVDRAPRWLDWDRIDDGVRFMHRAGLSAGLVLRDFALMGGYLLTGFNHTLVLTGALEKGAGRRVAETSKWWIDCTEPEGLRRFGPGFKSCLRVRLVHSMVRRSILARPDWERARWGVPVNQTDMLATYLAFGPVMLVGLRALGVPVLPRDARGVMHVWRYAAWLMGVEERWLVDDERAGLVRLYQTLLTQGRPDWTTRALGRALAEEPLQRDSPWRGRLPALHELSLRLGYHTHLSVTRMFLSRRQMRALGLPDRVVPWYPLLTAGPRAARHVRALATPWGRRRLEREGRRAQLEQLRAMFGEREHAVTRGEHLQGARAR